MTRYLPDRPLPPYAFEPGEHPHPTRDPGGHSRGREPEVTASDSFAWGVDLYNHGYLWEAHEAWEAPWRAAEPDSAQASFYQGLIQCAAACMKVRRGETAAAERLAHRAAGHLARAVEGGADTLGLDVPRFADRFARWMASGPRDVDTRPRMTLGDDV